MDIAVSEDLAEEEGKIDGNASRPGHGGRCSPRYSPPYSLSPPEAPRSLRCAIMSRCFRLFCCLRWLRLTPSSPGSGLIRRVRDIDPGSRTASGFLFLVTVIFAALDVGRLHQSDSVPPSWQLAAIMVFAAALILQAAAMIVNPFFSPALRIQAEHGHSVITRGPYRFLRHPGYLAMLMAMPAQRSGHRLVARLDSSFSLQRSDHPSHGD